MRTTLFLTLSLLAVMARAARAQTTHTWTSHDTPDGHTVIQRDDGHTVTGAPSWGLPYRQWTEQAGPYEWLNDLADALEESTPAAAPSLSDPTDADLRQAAAALYTAHPALRGRQYCVRRTYERLGSPPVSGWGDLGPAAVAACVPASAGWVAVVRDDTRRQWYLDPRRVDRRANGTVAFWVLHDAEDDAQDFLVARYLADCASRQLDTLTVGAVMEGLGSLAATHMSDQHVPKNVHRVRAGTVEAALLEAACARRSPQAAHRPRVATTTAGAQP